MSLNGDYSIFERSMNGVKTLSDGISTITDGVATHDKIFYTDEIQSSPDGQTTIGQTSITTIDVFCDTLTADNTDVTNMNADVIDSLRLRINDVSNNIIYDLNGNNSTAIFNGQTNFNNTVTLTNTNFTQTQTGEINQSGTGTNDLKDTNINGFLVVGSNITQNGGSTSLKDITCDNLTMRSGKSITQSGNTVSNTLAGTTTTKDLIILDSVVFPPNVTVPGTTTTDDIIMDGSSVIIQDLTVEPSGKTNIFRNTKTLDLEVDGDLDMIKAGSTATLKNTIIQGTAEIQGDITQTTGATVLKTISCNNITLNADQLITMSGTGYITQSGTGTNTLKAITLTNNSNLTFNGNGIISQPLNTSQNVLNNFRCAGYGIVGGRNNTTFTNTQNIQNNNGLQLQFNRDNSSQYSFIMNNRGSGGNGGMRFQRYVAGVYLDEPLTIDDNITMNKNVSIPGGSLSCSTATLGNISQTELNCLDNCTVNIQNEFNTINTEIDSLQASSSGNTTALTGISYTSATDTTLVDNNLTISDGKALRIGTQNIGVQLNANTTNVDTLLTRTSGMSYASATDTTTFNNNLLVGFSKKLFIGDMDVGAEITALETSITTGNIDTTNLTTNFLTVNVDATIENNLDVSNNITTNSLSCSGVSSFDNTINANANIEVDGLIRLKDNFNLNTIYELTTSQTLTFPLSEYNISNSSSFLDIVLPFIEPNQNDTFVSFILLNSSGTINITFPSGDLYNINNVKVVQVVLQNSLFKYVKLVSRNDSWYVVDYLSPNSFNGSTFNVSSTGAVGTDLTVGGILNVTGNSTFSGEHTVIGTVATNANYRLNNRTNLGGATNLNSNLNLSFPINEYYLVTNNNVAITATLPNLTNNNQNNAFATFMLRTTGSTLTIAKPSSTLFYDINQNPINSIQLSDTGYFSIKVFSSAGSWYVVDYVNNPDNLNTTTLTTTTANVTTANITTANITTINGNVLANSRIKTRSLVPGYLFDGASSFLTYPIVCSIKGFRPADTDDYYYINPGFKFEIYENDNYGGAIQYSLDNDTNEPTVKQAGTANKVGSIKVFYRNSSSENYVEITMPFIS